MIPEVEVVVQIGGEDVLAGRFWTHRRRDTESMTFSYLPDYLARDDAYELDPMLPLLTGQQGTPAGRPTFGAFSDCAPDRWGRRLIKRVEQRRAGHQKVTERSFGEADYLLGVRDDLRQGALRFRVPGSPTYLANERDGVPHLIQLPALLNAAERMERDEASEEELRTLLRGGSSLGGARPKAHVLGAEGKVAIAKFPSPLDDWDVMRYGQLPGHRRRHRAPLGRRRGGAATAVAENRVLDLDLKHRRSPAQSRLPAHEHRRLVSFPGL